MSNDVGTGMNVGTDVSPSTTSNGIGTGSGVGADEVANGIFGTGDLVWLENALKQHHISLTPQALEGVKNRVVKELEIRREEDEIKRSEEEEKRLEKEIEEGLRGESSCESASRRKERHCLRF